MIKNISKEKRTLILIISLAILLYLFFLGKGFLNDDYVHLHHAKTLSDILLSPDPFRLYRPLVVFSFYLNDLISPSQPFLFGLTNLLLHLAVIYLLFHLVLDFSADMKVSAFASLAFLLTPKAHSIAINWISGRTELLMALFFLLSARYCLQYFKQGKRRYLIFSVIFYFFSILSKESGVLAPLFFFITATVVFQPKKRFNWLWPYGLVFLVYLLLRLVSGALMPISTDSHYNLAVSPLIVVQNLFNYFFRSLPAPAIMLSAVLLPLWFARNLSPSELNFTWKKIKQALMLGGSWYLVFITPVLFIQMRSELYLYLAGTGFCILCGYLISAAFSLIEKKGKKIKIIGYSGLIFSILVLGGYIIRNNFLMARKATFSEHFIQSFKQQVVLPTPPPIVNLIPADSHTRDLLRDSLQGYFDVVIKLIYNRPDVYGKIQYTENEENSPRLPGQLDIMISTTNDQIRLTPRR